MTRGVLLDCDNALGLPACDVDDGLALLFLLAQPGVALRGVTTVFGNAGLGAVTRATRQLLRSAQSPDLLVVPGAARAGERETEAAHFLLRATKAEPGALTVLAIGPLTNVAAAAALDPGFFRRCREIICLGGSLGPARLGWRRLREVNFEADPAAARRVLTTQDCPVTVVPATSCVALKLRAADLPAIPPALRGPIRQWLLCCRLGRGIDYMVAWDLVAALALTHPALLRIETAQLSLIEDGLLQAHGDGPLRLVRGLADPAAAKAAVLAGLAPWQRSADLAR